MITKNCRNIFTKVEIRKFFKLAYKRDKGEFQKGREI